MTASSERASVWQGEFRLFGVVLHCHVLDDGTRIIEAQDMDALFEAMESPGPVDEDEIAAFSRWQRGGGDGQPATVHEHWFTPFAQVFGPYGPQDIHYHPCVEGEPGDCDAVMAGAGGRESGVQECHGTRSPHLRMDLTEDGLQPAEALSAIRATAPVAAKAEPPARRYSFTRDQLIEAVSQLEATVPLDGRKTILLNAESMADAIIEALEAGSGPEQPADVTERRRAWRASLRGGSDA